MAQSGIKLSEERWKALQLSVAVTSVSVDELIDAISAHNKGDGDIGSNTRQFHQWLRPYLSKIQTNIIKLEDKKQTLTETNKTLCDEVSKLNNELLALQSKFPGQNNNSDVQQQTKASTKTSTKVSEEVKKEEKSEPSNSAQSDARVAVDTGLHVIKGAIVKVYNIPTGGTTQTVHFSDEPWVGAITVAHDSVTKPDDNTKKKIEDYCNELIRKNVEITIHKDLDRQDAEKKFGPEIYDAYPVPAKVTRLNVLEIAQWNVNCCPKVHCQRTGELIGLKIGKIKFNNKKNSVNIYFKVGPEFSNYS
ncbi:hypothetical protein RFI_13424 [Reticulomyxa filosa]|uniref:Threonyl/alanyl tRNA synthetase SAD domain-containing protein n=1 Tax=Reticulomyxa filosa TaxID=46433 RepID=X6NCP9_RETFI|nr:hypothetical protein RFI_13424 [Reticulomyxa filosa]|eukprot:ETO23756.1 hypothetical protein RFI_13424 [Reticulomyxa filosa]